MMPKEDYTENPGFSSILRPLIKLLSGRRQIIILLVIFIMIQSCFRPYFKTNSKYAVDTGLIAAISDTAKYVILHLRNGNFLLDSIRVHDDMIEGEIKPPDSKHIYYDNPMPGSSPSYKQKHRNAVLSEIHIYAQQLDSKPHISFPLKSITRVDAYKPNPGKTFAAFFLSVTGLAIVALFAVFGLVVLFYQGS